MRTLHRRRFLHDTASLAAALSAIPSGMSSADHKARPLGNAKPAGPNETLRMAVVGVRGRGMDHIEGLGRQKDVRITAICDIDQNVIGPAIREIEKLHGKA